ncbi:MAG: hypothetical protein OXC95_00225 [Dehalococcoidia bacterium]|nr:hypothetical protein [Dehalococcoidia bacterium]
MTIHINTTDDFLRALRGSEEFRSAARRELLTEELLEVPGQLVDIRKTQNAMLEEQGEMRKTQNAMLEEQGEMRKTQNAMLEEQGEMRAKSDALQETQNAMLEEQREMRKTQNAMLEELREMRAKSDALQETQNALLETVATLLRDTSEIKTDTRALHGMYRREHQDLQRFRGNYASSAARQNRNEIARLFARSRLMRRIRYNVLDSMALDTMVQEKYESMDDLGLRDDAWDDFPAADLVIEVTGRDTSIPGFYIVVEASYTAGSTDVLRARERAQILRWATGLDAYAVVAAVRLAPNIQDIVEGNIEGYLEAGDEDGVFWFPLVEEDLEPPDPC